MSESLVLYACGCPVEIGEDIPAVVTAISILSNNRVRYEVAWWDGRARKTDEKDGLA